MICRPCREKLHGCCPELFRQEVSGLKPYELAASARCDCQHQPAPATLAASATSLPLPVPAA